MEQVAPNLALHEVAAAIRAACEVITEEPVSYRSADAVSSACSAVDTWFIQDSASSHSATMWEMIRVDCAGLVAAERLDRRPLWAVENPFAPLWAGTHPRILAQGNGWRFWVDWYENTLHGRAQDLDLLIKIARITAEDWDKGADHVNALIAEIIKAHRLAAEARAFKHEIAQLRAELQTVQRRSHNNPPELID